jgi:hypothetical protein
MAINMDALLRIKAAVLGENNIRRLGNSLQGLQGQAKNAALGFNNLKGAVAGFGAAIAGSAIVAGLGAIVKKATDAGGDLDDLQIKTGIAASALFAIGNAAKVAGVDMDTVGKGLGKLNINLVKAAEGNEDLAQKFKRLGVDVKDAKGQVVPADKALKQIADRFADMPDGAQKAAAAVALFGKGGADLIPLLNEGAAGLELFKSKLTPKEFEEFTARSDKFGESITKLIVKTGAFALDLTAALLPALQSILDVFSDLFNTDKDFKALFQVIEFAVRGIAVAIYTVVKVVDILVKNIFAALQAAKQALAGDFAGAFKTITTGVSSGFAEAKQGIADLNKLAFGSSAAPKAKAPGRAAALDTSAADAAGAAAARKAATEQERAAQRYNEGLEGAIDLAGDLNKQIRDISLSTQDVGADPVDQILSAFQKNLNSIQDEQEVLFKKADEFTNKTGIKFEGLRNKIKKLGAVRTTEAAAVRDQGLIDLLPSVKEYNDKIAEISRGKTELTELEKLNAQVNLLQLDILAATNPALAEHVRLLRERAGALDAATAKQKTDNESIGAGIKDRLQEYYNSIKDIGGAIGDAVVGSLKGLEDQLTAFVTTGKASFNDLAASIIQDLSRIAIRAAIIKPITEAIGSLFPGFKFANGGIMTGDGPMPLKKYASGGIANSPQLALYGEGSRPEAFVPLPDGRRIPVAMQGGGGGSTNVTVNVDASGNASVQGDQAQAKQLGVAVSAAVQAELVKQQRPGGILAGTRR